MINMILAGYFLYQAFGYFKESEFGWGVTYIGLAILNIALGLVID